MYTNIPFCHLFNVTQVKWKWKHRFKEYKTILFVKIIKQINCGAENNINLLKQNEYCTIILKCYSLKNMQLVSFFPFV